ncbi:hypothetical protein [Hymenobacter sp. UYCo722]|uniref:hypothetical protein n=1 Tax=Hymenobacter sp. UYCo722 TaxID=3156335 RepID=UPI003394C811
MPVATPFRRFSFRSLVLLVALGSLAGGCQSSRPSFSFQPAVLRATTAMPAPRVARAPVPVAAPVAAAEAAPRAATAALPSTIEAGPLRATAPHPAARPAETVASVAPASASSVRRTHRPLLHRAHASAEAGLGTTVFGILGIVTLPIALLGLLLSGGGLVWGIVAAAAALAILVAYLDPFGRR